MAIIPTQTYSALPVDELPLLDLLANMSRAVSGNKALSSWCDFNFGRQVSVFSGSDPDNPPKEPDYPLVELVSMDDNHGREIDRPERLVGLVCGIHDSEVEPQHYNGLTIQRGLLRLEEFYRLVLTAVAGADLLGGYIATVEAQREDENLFPFFLLGAEISIVKP